MDEYKWRAAKDKECRVLSPKASFVQPFPFEVRYDGCREWIKGGSPEAADKLLHLVTVIREAADRLKDFPEDSPEDLVRRYLLAEIDEED